MNAFRYNNTSTSLEQQLIRLYDAADDIRYRISVISDRNNINGSLTYDDRILLDTFTNMYTTTIRQIDCIYNLIENTTTTQRPRSYAAAATSRETINSSRTPNPNTTPAANRPRRYSLTEPINNYINNLSTRYVLTEALRSFSDPVVVAPTLQQIENATNRTIFDTIDNPPNISCPISLDRFENDDSVMVIRHCGHVFQTQSLQRWFRANVRCPVCRYDIRNYVQGYVQRNDTSEEEQPYSPQTYDVENNSDNEEGAVDDSMPDLEPIQINTNSNANTPVNSTGEIFSNLATQALSQLFNVEHVGNVTYDPSSELLVFDAIIQGIRR